MVVKIQNAGATALDALAYNQSKVYSGGADIVAFRNLQSSDPFTLQDTFSSLESSAAVREGVRRFSFHATIDPSESDGTTDGCAVAMAGEIMSELGFASQPWVMYRHHDIERVHYHIVSSRIRPDGSVVDDSHDRRRLQALLGAMAPRYGFAVGRSDGRRRAPVEPEWSFRRGNGPVTVQLALLLSEAESYAYAARDSLRLSSLLRLFGVGMRVGRRSRTVFGLDALGQPCTRPLRADRLLDRFPLQSVSGPPDFSRIISAVPSCLDGCPDRETFISRLSLHGIGCVMSCGSDGLTESVVMADHITRSVAAGADIPELGLLEVIRARERTGIWSTAAGPAWTGMPERGGAPDMVGEERKMSKTIR